MKSNIRTTDPEVIIRAKERIGANIKYLLEEKFQLERDIRVGEEAKTSIVETEIKLTKLMEEYMSF